MEDERVLKMMLNSAVKFLLFSLKKTKKKQLCCECADVPVHEAGICSRMDNVSSVSAGD